jgi:D-psicose/D-tagatose/L-ribulose 3-epimerase
MRFGVCTSIDNSALMKSQGWDFVEENCQQILQRENVTSALPVLAANCLFPGSIKMTEEFGRQRAEHLEAVGHRARQLGIRTIVFGSGAARNVPEGHDRSRAASELRNACRVMAAIGSGYDITFVIEHLRRAECNIVNTLSEAVALARDVSQPNVQCVLDTYHLWSEAEPLDHVRYARPWIRHVHVADLEGRVAPGLSGKSDYQPVFAILREGNYHGLISVEASQFDIAKDGERVLAFLRDHWENA